MGVTSLAARAWRHFFSVGVPNFGPAAAAPAPTALDWREQKRSIKGHILLLCFHVLLYYFHVFMYYDIVNNCCLWEC